MIREGFWVLGYLKVVYGILTIGTAGGVYSQIVYPFHYAPSAFSELES